MYSIILCTLAEKMQASQASRPSFAERLKISRKAVSRMRRKAKAGHKITVVQTTDEDMKETMFRQKHAILAFFRYFDCFEAFLVEPNSHAIRIWDKLIVLAAIAAGVIIPYMAAFPMDENYSPTAGECTVFAAILSF